MTTKAKMWWILQILKETDEHYPLTTNEIIKKLEKDHQITAERKSVYRDIDTLRNECEIDIAQAEGTQRGYYLMSREFEEWEIKVLIDAVLGMRFLPRSDVDILVKKLCKQGSRFTEKILKAVTPVSTAGWPENHGVKRYIDTILKAIKQNRQVQFQYFDLAPDGKQVLRRDGRLYHVNPYALILRGGMYYLVGNYVKFDSLSYYRLDRMTNLTTALSPRLPLRTLLGANAAGKLSNFVNRSPHHFAGEEITLELDVKSSLTDDLLFQFGTGNVRLTPLAEPDDYGFTYRAVIKVQDSEGLYFWLMQYANSVRVIGPGRVRKQFTSQLESVLAMYK